MSLLELKTNLKTLKYGQDRPGGGSSGQPYIQLPIEEQDARGNIKNLISTNRTSLDFPMRGGTSVFDSFSTTSVHAQIDKERISKFFKDKPRGEAFLLKQSGLQLSNPKVQTGETIFTQRLGFLPSLIENTRVYNNGKNTLAQVSVQGTGTNFRRAGITPASINDKFYQDVLSAERSMTVEEVQKNNRLLIMRELKMRQNTAGGIIDISQAQNNIETINRLGISLNRNILFQYLGGPGSVYGVGSTTIRRSKDSDTTEAINQKVRCKGSEVVMSSLAMTYTQIMAKGQTLPATTSSLITDYKDFRTGSAQTDSWQKDGRIDVKFFDGRVDKMNSLGAQSLDVSSALSTDSINKDIIKFLFECVEYETANPTLLFFRAYLSSITDNNSGNWNSFKYVGRGENFYTYQGFDRSISFSFKVGLGSKSELKSTYEKLNYLVSQVYPDYSAIGFMRAPIVKLTIGDYLYRVPGILENVNLTIDQTSTWEIDEKQQVPHFIDVSVGFRPILENLPRRSQFGKTNTDLIYQNQQ